MISDGRIGHQNQSLSLCRIMGWEARVIHVKFKNGLGRILTIVNELASRRNEELVTGLEELEEHSGADVVVCTGSRTYYAAKIASRNLDVPSVALMNPGVFSKGFSAILVPSYENKFPEESNVIKVPVNISIPDEKVVAESINELHKRVQSNYQKCWGIIIGGNNKTSRLIKGTLQKRLEAIIALTPYDTTLFVTTSRRSGKGVEALLRNYEKHFGLIVYASTDSYNPIPAFTRVCERIFVTSDSANMISEVATSGNAFVEVLMNWQKYKPNKFLNFIASLSEKEVVHEFEGDLGYANKKVGVEGLVQEVEALIDESNRLKSSKSNGNES